MGRLGLRKGKNRIILVASSVVLAGLLLAVGFVACDGDVAAPVSGESSEVGLSSQPASLETLSEEPASDSEAVGDVMSPALRASFIQARQAEAGPEFSAAHHGKVPAFTNGRHRLRAELESDAIRLSSISRDDAWTFTMRLDSVTRGSAIETSVRATRSVKNNRATYSRGDVEEWYLNGPVGLEQGFDIAKRLLEGSSGELELRVKATSALTIKKENEDLVLLNKNGAVVLRSFGLLVLDANGEELPSHFKLVDEGFAIVFDDSEAEYPVHVDPVWGGEVKLLASDGATGDAFGISVAVSGDTAIVGAWEDDDGGSNAGSAYVFIRQGITWIQEAKLTANDAAADDLFGGRVSLDGDTAVVSAMDDDDNGYNSGSAYVFTRTGSIWTQEAKLLGSVVTYDGGFGISVSVSGDTVLVGSSGDNFNGPDTGSAYVFTRSGSTWSQQAKLTANDAADGDNFGHSVSLWDDVALIGAYWDDDNGLRTGSAYVFTRAGSSWTQEAKLNASDAAIDDQFGNSVAIHDDIALIGSWQDDNVSGSAYVFSNSGGSWVQEAKLSANDGAPGDRFGCWVALSGDTALIGARQDDDNGSNSGSAYVFTRHVSSWSQAAKLLASDGAAGDYFGATVSVSGNTALVAAVRNDDNGVDSGSAYIFTFSGSNGEPCMDDTECHSGYCVDSVCCDTACGGDNPSDCEACSTTAGSSVDGICEGLDGVACDDGLFCTDGDICTAGVCDGTAHDCSSLDNDCNQGVCNDTSDSCEASPINEGGSCDDGLFCNDGETCSSGICEGGIAHDCSSLDNDCNQGVCNDTSDSCEESPINEGGSCDDGLFCNDGETCSAGICGGGIAHDCSSLDNDCNQGVCNDTSDACEASPINEGGTCNDGLFCTDGDTCAAGACDGTAHDCSSLDNDCNQGVCNDTSDSCEASPINEGGSCDDGLFCNDGETCSSGVCGGGVAHDCSLLDDDCNQGVCNDTTDACEATPINEGGSCDDGLFCNDGETCSSGICGGGVAHDCSSLDNDCNQGVCNDTSDACEASPINEGGTCDDGLFCTDVDICASGVCDGTAHDCSSLDDDCNHGVCNDTSDACESSPINEGGSCDDGDENTINDICTDGSCAGTPDGDTDSDTDSDSDSDSDSDTGNETDAGNGKSDNGGCGCYSVGGVRGHPLISTILSTLV